MVPELIVSKALLAKLLARQYPFVFVDESQDTLPEVVECLRHVSRQERGGFCLGFFGDPMQCIYTRGVGAIAPDNGWKEIAKPENFRSPTKVLEVINAIRASGDGLHQVSGLPVAKRRPGEVDFFVLPANETRTESLTRALEWLAENSQVGAWGSRTGANEVKVLVIAHRMAARRLGFEGLYGVFHDSTHFSDAFDEGRAWPISPFSTMLLPLSRAFFEDRSQLVPILRRSSPLLCDDNLSKSNVLDRLRTLSLGAEEVARIISSGGSGSVEKALLAAQRAQLVDLDQRLLAALGEANVDMCKEMEQPEVLEVLRGYFACDVREVEAYLRYIDRESPYSTHQGVKGAEYPSVLVVLDDEEGRHNQFSYDKLLGIKPLSQRDHENISAGKDTAIARTRRLLYVCASRATEALAVVMYARDVDAALQALKSSGIPGAGAALTLSDITPTSQQ